jgi:hypothetical protein
MSTQIWCGRMGHGDYWTLEYDGGEQNDVAAVSHLALAERVLAVVICDANVFDLSLRPTRAHDDQRRSTSGTSNWLLRWATVIGYNCTKRGQVFHWW